ncbi:MAG: DUF72 domain-containing protein [Acidobacteriota bacterium]|nr:DUF72 domain-containing protein [Acidobacteriota bacterium]MDH3786698.1 DUF72 domain-containing protein [Acidobacteriota bacterium]
MSRSVRIGLAGWDYPDWSGVVYPARSSSRFDRLEWISRFVDVIEVNASFYRHVAASTSRSWATRVADRPDFRFTAKSHRDWTHGHEDLVESAVSETLRGLEPLSTAGRLLCILVQFPQRFHRTEENRRRLERIRLACDSLPWAVELRHRSWDHPETFEWLTTHQINWCAIDQPRASRQVLKLIPRVTGKIAYLRFHGRNSREWFAADTNRDRRYDYLYSGAEVAEFAGCVESLAKPAEQLVAIQNNHFRGQALVNALQLLHVLTGERPPAPQELVHHYPALEDQVTVRRDTLF